MPQKIMTIHSPKEHHAIPRGASFTWRTRLARAHQVHPPQGPGGHHLRQRTSKPHVQLSFWMQAALTLVGSQRGASVRHRCCHVLRWAAGTLSGPRPRAYGRHSQRQRNPGNAVPWSQGDRLKPPRPKPKQTLQRRKGKVGSMLKRPQSEAIRNNGDRFQLRTSFQTIT